jgi:hypothetical protein
MNLTALAHFALDLYAVPGLVQRSIAPWRLDYLAPPDDRGGFESPISTHNRLTLLEAYQLAPSERHDFMNERFLCP